MPFYQKTIDLAKAEVQNTIANLASKGVNVTEIEKQTQSTADHIAIIEAKMEELPLKKDVLIKQYQKEKELQMERSTNKDHLKERELENRSLFGDALPTGPKERVKVTVKNPALAVESYRFIGRR